MSLGVRGVKRTRCSAYGNSGPSGVIVYDWGRLIGPPGNYKRWSSSASSGSVGIGYDNRPSENVEFCSHPPYNFSGRYRYSDLDLARIMEFMVLCPTR
ncbi:hypothetical protein PIB30_037132 [Stylosanthes scabra]|uniref:Uncharacterized protein n=1 Tax=Stylosanthes scabra TaxID=79078 RepID=A0ABU6QD46_9FABA|nr:hypothetical protein [Stylosanthes scabra]